MQWFQDHNQSISEIVRQDYRTSDVFKKYGINYCCNVHESLSETCRTKQINYDVMLLELNEATRIIQISTAVEFSKWRLDFLIDYILNVHHPYQQKMLPVLRADLVLFVGGHQEKYPCLAKASALFSTVSELILLHNRHEEEIIFPYIKQIESTYRRKEIYGNLFVRTLRKPLSHIDNEHDEILESLKGIQSVTNNYLHPDNACTSHQVVFKKLKEFHLDMLQHHHLENDILFPRAIELEKELLQL